MEMEKEVPLGSSGIILTCDPAYRIGLKWGEYLRKSPIINPHLLRKNDFEDRHTVRFTIDIFGPSSTCLEIFPGPRVVMFGLTQPPHYLEAYIDYPTLAQALSELGIINYPNHQPT